MANLVFSGSGALYPAHLGAAKCLYDYGLRPRNLIGTSGGAIVAAFLSTGIKPSAALEAVKQTLPRNVISLNWNPFSRWGMFSLKKMERALRPHVPRIFAYAKIPLWVVTTDVGNRRSYVFSSHETPTDKVSKAVRASASMPGIMVPVRHNNMWLTDGGVTDNFALDLLPGPTVGVRLLSNSGDALSEPTDWRTYLTSVLGCMMSEIERKHIEDAMYAKVINIELNWNPVDFWRVTDEVVEQLYKAGYEQTQKKLESGWTWRASNEIVA